MTKLVVEEVTCAVGKSPIGEPRTAMPGPYRERILRAEIPLVRLAFWSRRGVRDGATRRPSVSLIKIMRLKCSN